MFFERFRDHRDLHVLTHSFPTRRSSDLGFDPSNVLLAGINLSEQGYDAEQGKLFMRNLRDRVESLPGVQAVSFDGQVPLSFEIGRAHVRTPVTNAHLVCRLLLDKKHIITFNTNYPTYYTKL